MLCREFTKTLNLNPLLLIIADNWPLVHLHQFLLSAYDWLEAVAALFTLQEYLDVAERHGINPASLAIGMLFSFALYGALLSMCMVINLSESGLSFIMYLSIPSSSSHSARYYFPWTAFVLKHPLVASVIFGVTKSWQLSQVINSCNVEITPEITAEINRIHARYPNPCPWSIIVLT